MSSHNKMNDGAKEGDFFGTGHDELWHKHGDFLGQEKLMLSHNETNYRTKPGLFWDKRRQNYIITR